LSSSEVAARLSFLIWNSIPDDALNMAVDKNLLQDKTQIMTQAQRLLKSPKAAGVATTFHRTYAGIENGSHWANNNSHDATKYPSFTAASYTDSMTEIDSFFQDLVATGGTFKDIYTGSNGFVTKDTAAIYGLKPADFNATPKKTPLDATQRPGFLTRVGFLSTFAHSDRSSPILRGAFITQKVLRIPVGAPDPKFVNVQPPAKDYKTQRESTEALTMGSPCNSCHTNMVNPPGFVLERYNAIGGWQDTDPLGGPIDSTTDVMISTTVTKNLSKPVDLMTEIAKAPNAQSGYAQAWVVYATSRSLNPADQCIVDKLTTGLADASYPITSMMADYTQADSFRLRTVGN
jgi:hypothetical protein